MFGCLLPSINVYAFGLSDLEAYFDVQQRFKEILWQNNQIMTTQEHMQNILEDMYGILADGGYSGGSSASGLSSNGLVTINSDSGEVSCSDTLSNAISQAVANEINNRMGFKYCYSTGSSQWLDQFQDQTKYHAFLDLISEMQEDNYIIVNGLNYQTVYTYPRSNCEFVNDGYNSSMGAYWVKVYENWQYGSVDFNTYSYDSNMSQYVLGNTSTRDFRVDVQKDINSISGLSMAQWVLTDLNQCKYILYNSFEAMRAGTEGVQEYYTGNDFSTNTVNTTQTWTNTQLSNSISYGDVNNYVNNYYVTNGDYPTPNEINIYINTYDPNNNGGGGSGGGSDSPSWDFGFLSTIAEFIASLISALGDVVGGVLSAITSIITSLREGIPNTIGLFLEWFFPFLPDEIVALLELSILCMVLVGIIRLIRGH